MNSLTRFFVFGLSVVGVAVLSLCVYRLWLHPLAKYPGPFWSRLTNFHAAYHAWKGDLHLDMKRCHDKYGDHVRYGPDRILFNNATALKDTYSFGKNVQKCKGYLTMMHRVPNTITQRNKELHAKQRALLSRGFSDAALRAHQETICFHIKKLLRHFDEQSESAHGGWSSPKDMSELSDYVTFDIMLDVVYGQQSEMLTKADNRYLISAIRESNIRVGVLMPLWYLKGTYLERFIFPRSIIARHTFLTFVKALLKDKEIEEMKGSGTQSVYSILKEPSDHFHLGPSEIAAESTNLVIAGFDTTATVLSAFFFYLSRSASAYEKVTSEVRSVFCSLNDLQNRSLVSRLAYLRACIDETMRMAPPIPSALFRETESTGATIDRHAIPPGYDVGTSIYCIHHNATYFPEPFEFQPERWIVHADKSNQGNVERAQDAFTPFSIGPRACIGRGLAMMELQSIIVHVLFHFDFRAAEGDLGRVGEGKEGAKWGRHREKEYQLFDHLTATRSGPYVQFRKRLS